MATKKEQNIEMGSRLKRMRENLGCSQGDFAATLKITEEHYRRLELGINRIVTDKLKILLDVYGISADYILSGKENTEYPDQIESYLTICTDEQAKALIQRLSKYVLSTWRLK